LSVSSSRPSAFALNYDVSRKHYLGGQSRQLNACGSISDPSQKLNVSWTVNAQSWSNQRKS